MSTKAEWRASTLEFYESGTQERVARMAPVQFYEDFLGAFTAIPDGGSEESGCNWSTKIVGAAPPTVAGVADAANGVIQCALTSDSQKQDACLYMGDQRGFDVSKGLIFEARVCVTVTPTLVAEAYWGLFDDWTDGLVDSATYMACFCCDGSTSVYCESDDDATDESADSGVVAGTTTWRVYRIDFSDVTDVQFFIDGNRVASSTTFAYAAIGANAILQPAVGLYKASGAGVGTVQVDYIKIWQNRA